MVVAPEMSSSAYRTVGLRVDYTHRGAPCPTVSQLGENSQDKHTASFNEMIE